MKGTVLAVLFVAAAATLAAQQQVTSTRILNAEKEPHNWLTYSGGYKGQRYSTLDQITPRNVKDLQMRWAFQVSAE